MIAAGDLHMNLVLDPIVPLSKDLAKASVTLSLGEIRFLVDAYYAIQTVRVASGNQSTALEKTKEPHEVLDWTRNQMEKLEHQILRALDKWSDRNLVAAWMKSITGIGPVLASGFSAHIDPKHCQTAGSIWRFAGLDPSQKWEKGQKRPWNADLKVLTWKLGESFVKVSANANDTYGRIYVKRKELEAQRNDSGQTAGRAAEILASGKFKKTTETHKHLTAGHLPPAQIHGRAKRYAVKLFLSDLQVVMYFVEYGLLPALPYILTHDGANKHVHLHAPPNMNLIPGLEEAWAERAQSWREHVGRDWSKNGDA
jgi:Transposase IS116/IS110/IS902 family